jgi:hypothetical protein
MVLRRQGKPVTPAAPASRLTFDAAPHARPSASRNIKLPAKHPRAVASPGGLRYYVAVSTTSRPATTMTNEWTAAQGFIANSAGVSGGALVGGITFLIGAPWWSLPVCAAAGLLISRLSPAERAVVGSPLGAALRLCRSLPLWDRLAMSAVLVVAAAAVYIGLKELHILSAFYLFLLPIVLAGLLFGARCGFAAAFLSLIAIYYFAIPPKNSFALQGLRELCLLAAFALLAFITSATMAVQSDRAWTRDQREPL